MKRPLARKIIESHLVAGRWEIGAEIGIRIDQTLTQDATGTLAYLEFETLGLDSVKTELSASYVDHNLLQTDFKNADDHRFLRSCAMKYGIWFSPPGNGISHPVHMERFGAPGKTLLGSDSHTSTAGALGMLAIGAGGLDVALAMAGEPFFFRCPSIMGVRLTGRLKPWVSAKDVILEMLRRHTVKGGIGKIIEYWGTGVATLSATERATIANMGAELGATTSIFPSDKMTKEFLGRCGRVKEWKPLEADKDAVYDEVDEMDLSSLAPLIACPSSPDNVKKVSEVAGTPIGQVIIGSSVNFSYHDLMTAALVVKGKTVHPNVSFEINPGSRTVLENVERSGGTVMLTHAGGRIHQSGCLGCIGMGQAPATGTASVRTFPRNFPGRSGTEEDKVYLASPQTCVASALNGSITDPVSLGRPPRVVEPKRYVYNAGIIQSPLPLQKRKKVEIIRGPNIMPFPAFSPIPDNYEGKVLLKTGDNVTTDHILPAGNEILPLRSNIPAISEYCFSRVDKGFAARCRQAGGGIIVAGENYGQGSSREHAAIAPAYLGIRAVIAEGFARIHRTNLINFGVVPLLFADSHGYDKVGLGMTLRLTGIRKALKEGVVRFDIDADGGSLSTRIDLTPREAGLILAGGALNFIRDAKAGDKTAVASGVSS